MRRFLLTALAVVTLTASLGRISIFAAEKLTVFAAASLTDPLKEIKRLFEARHPGVEVVYNMAGSPELRAQIELDAPCDVFASADMKNMLSLEAKNLLRGGYRIFARNKLCVIIPRENRAGIRSLKDLARPGVKIDGGVEGLPASRYMRQVVESAEKTGKYGSGFAAKVYKNTFFQEMNVKHIVAKIILNDFDAGFVYVTDVTPEVKKSVKVIHIPDSINVIAKYPIAVIKGAQSPGLAEDFIKLITSRQGQAIMKKNGFLKP
ncbi:MAG: molybdate ABC transporter substrate-binding protein [Armatimonadetes bacterium]|nr:molybdate ABC transporter substrate-binding protein [Armatimonadota bacterium]